MLRRTPAKKTAPKKPVKKPVTRRTTPAPPVLPMDGSDDEDAPIRVPSRSDSPERSDGEEGREGSGDDMSDGPPPSGKVRRDTEEPPDDGEEAEESDAADEGGLADAENEEDEDLPGVLNVLTAYQEGYDGFQDRLDRQDPLAQGMLDAWEVDDVTGPKGLRAWMLNIHGITPAVTAPELLMAVDDLPDKTDPEVWRVLGDMAGLEKEDPAPEDVLARTVVAQVMDGDEAVRKQIVGFYEDEGLDFENYELAFAREGGLAIFGDPTTDQPLLATLGYNGGSTRTLTETQLKAVHGDLKPGVVGKWTKAEKSAQHSLDRLAWVMANLKSSRECVAVVTAMQREIRLFANTTDARMGPDFHGLLAAAEADRAEAQRMIAELYQTMVDTNLEQRLVKGADIPRSILRQAERRLRKTVEFLHKIHGSWEELRVYVHGAAYKGAPTRRCTPRPGPVTSSSAAGTTRWARMTAPPTPTPRRTPTSRPVMRTPTWKGWRAPLRSGRRLRSGPGCSAVCRRRPSPSASRSSAASSAGSWSRR